MRLSRFYKLFPVPPYLNLSTVGLDISDESVKFIELTHTAVGFHLSHFGHANFPVGAIVSGKIIKREDVLAVLKKIKEENNFSLVHLSLLEEECFVAKISIPASIKPKDLRGSIELQLEEYIPLRADQVIFDYEIHSRPTEGKGNYTVSVLIAPKTLVADYTSLIREAGLAPASVEIEVESIARALIAPTDQNTYLIVDLGKTRTGFTIVDHGVSFFSTTINSISGETFTKAVQKVLNVSEEEAEQAKIKNGLRRSSSDNKVFESLLPAISSLKDEIGRYCNYWNDLAEENESRKKISKVILSGGQASLPGLAEYLAADLKTSVEVGNPWTAFSDDKEKLPKLDFNNSLRYVTAIGLALRGTSCGVTVNLLPETEQKNIVAEYRRRISASYGFGLSALLVAMILTVIGLNTALWIEQNSLIKTKQTMVAGLETADDKPAIQTVASLNKMINYLVNDKKNLHSVTVLIDRINELKPAGIKITTLDLDRASSGWSITLRGWSAKRQDIVDFVAALEKCSLLTEINSPVANLLKETKGDFIITVILATGK